MSILITPRAFPSKSGLIPYQTQVDTPQLVKARVYELVNIPLPINEPGPGAPFSFQRDRIVRFHVKGRRVRPRSPSRRFRRVRMPQLVTASVDRIRLAQGTAISLDKNYSMSGKALARTGRLRIGRSLGRSLGLMMQS